MSVIDDLAAELGVLEQAHALRLPDVRLTAPAGGWIDVSSNDYLGFASLAVSRETLDALSVVPSGAGASRLIHGTRGEHTALERELAAWVRASSALLFTSGFAANVGCLSALAAAGDLVVSDALNHASLIDGCRLSRATVRVVPHRDLSAVERALAKSARRKWVVTESYFSMDGDSPDLPALRALCDRLGAGLIVDEAHALGVFGPEGSGLCAQAGVVPDALIGTLGKAVGIQGAFIAGSSTLRGYLWNRARTFVFSTAASPLLAAALRPRIEAVRAAHSRRDHLFQLCAYFEDLLLKSGIPLPLTRHGPIFPIIVGSNAAALRVANSLRQHGFLAQAIRPPTVPESTSRLRITLNASLRPEQLERLVDLIQRCTA